MKEDNLKFMRPELKIVSPLRNSNYIMVLCLTERVAHWFYRLEGRIQEKSPKQRQKKDLKNYPHLFKLFLRNNAKSSNSFKIMKNCPQTWAILSRALKKYPTEVMVFGGNRIYRFHIPENILTMEEKHGLYQVLDNTNENLQERRMYSLSESA